MADQWMLKAVLSAVDKMSPVLKGVAKTARTTRKYLTDIGGSAVNLAGQIGMPLGLISGALAGFTVAGVQQAVTGFARLSGEIDDAAQRLGISAAEYQRLKYFAEQSGASVEGLSSSMGRLNKGIAEAAAGKNKSLAGLFARAGISMRDANGNLRQATDMLPEIAALFERNQNAAVRARIGTAIFGKSWAELAPLLQEGEAGIAKLTARYAQLGTTIDEKAIKAGAEFDDQLNDLRAVAGSYGTTIAAKLLPVLAPLIEQTIQWAIANRELITTKVSAFITDLATSLAKVDWSGVIQGVGDFVRGVKDLIDWMGGAKNALLWLVFVMNIQAIAAFASLIGAIGRASLAFLGFAAKTIPKALLALESWAFGAGTAAVATDGLTASTKAADAAAGGWFKNLKGIAGILGTIGAAAAPLAAIWGVKEWAEDTSNDQGRVEGLQSVGSSASGFLSMFGFDKNAEIEALREASRADLVTPANRVQASGTIEVSFKDAPPGMRVEQAKTAGDVPINTSVGYRSFATGMPY